MPYYKTPIIYPTGLIREDTQKINDNFTQLASAFVNEDPTTNTVINADKVDGYHASTTPGPTTIPVLDANAILNLVNSPAIITKHYTFRRIFGNTLTSDYPLARGEEIVYSWDTNVRLSMPLYISSPGGVYQMIIINVYQNASDISTYLNPNNTTYSNAIITSIVGWQDMYTSAIGGTYTESAFNLYNATSGGITEVFLSTYKYAKFSVFIQRSSRKTGGGCIFFGGSRWEDPNTEWTSLGTLTTNAGNGGVIILVRRVF
ncbi:MAG: hypothetical protein ACP5H0_07750 [Caldisericum sp.]|uniref:hypothetical protein n=1 Tax=Caldisericum sp. TaxID=2499687 RepID=UPI003D141588